MDDKEKAKEKHISMLELEGEELDKELTVEQKKAAIAEAKKLYGRDWKKILFGAVKSLKINKETLQTLHGMGVNSSLKEMNDPRIFRR
jgi:hypothetical protein